MMFVFGEVADPLQESTLLVEDIVRSQVIEIVSFAPFKPLFDLNKSIDYTSYSTSK
jgi:hypothetical protein